MLSRLKFRFHLGGGDACVKVQPNNFILMRSRVDPITGGSSDFGRETEIRMFVFPGGPSLCMDVGSDLDPTLVVLVSCSDDSPTQKWQMVDAPEPF